MHSASEHVLNDEIKDAAGAAKEQTLQNADPPKKPDSERQDEAKQPASQGRPDTAKEPDAPGADAPDTAKEPDAPKADAPDTAKAPDTSDTGQTEQTAAGDAAAAENAAATENAAGAEDAAAAKNLLANAPTLEQLEKELKKERLRVDFSRVLRNTIFSLIVVAAVSALIAVLFLPVLQIHGSSMDPTLSEQDIVAALSVGSCRQGDLIAFYYNNNILIKRVIAGPGDWVEIDAEGNVSVNGQPLEEPYLTEKALGNCDITFPYQVPDARYFVMGDHRATSVDSRSEALGCVSREMIIGRIFLRVWPLESLRLF